jgi:hypothetical protein
MVLKRIQKLVPIDNHSSQKNIEKIKYTPIKPPILLLVLSGKP